MQNIIYRFEKSEEYKVIPFNNVRGSITHKGDIFLDLVVEYPENPEEVIYNKTNEGIVEELSREPKEELIIVQSMIGTIITKETAKSLAYWLLNKVDELEKNS